MLFLPLIVLVAVVIVIVVVATQRHDGPPGRPDVGPDDEFGLRLTDWVDAGLLTRATADAIAAHERARIGRPRPAAPARQRAVGQPRNGTPLPAGAPPRRSLSQAASRRVPLVAEALGYLGGTLAIVGVVLLVARYWTDLATPARLAVCGAGAVGLFAAGALTREASDPAFARLRWFTWLGSTAALGLFVGVALHDGFGVGREPRFIAAAVGAGALYAAVLWGRKDRPVQQLTALGAAVVAAGVAVGEFASAGPAGLAVWAIGAAYLAAWFARWTPQPLLTGAVGAAAVVVGALVSTSSWPSFGLPFALATAAALTAMMLVPGLVDSRPDRLVIGIIGGVALLQSVPSTIGYFGREGGAATGLVTWTVGAVLLALGSRRLVRLPLAAELVGGAAIIGGGALTAAQWPGFGPVFGIVTALGLIAVGMLPGRVLLSVLGSVGLLINVPWAIAHFFPGEDRAPLLILVSGALILGVAVLLARLSPRLRQEIGGKPAVELDVREPDAPPATPLAPPATPDNAAGQTPSRR